MMTSEEQPTSVTRDDARDCVSTASVKRSAAERQRDYRLRRGRAAIDAIGEEASASRVTLLTLLGHDLAAMEDRTTPDTLISARRSSIKRILTTIITRYAIDLTGDN